MKNVLLLLNFSFLFLGCDFSLDKGVKISGSVKNSEQEYVNLTYVPRFRGNLNFDGFKSVGSNIDSKGNFKLLANKITDAANYSLEFQNQSIQLILFEGDNIHLTFDLNNLDNSLFATGKGAGKINVLNLKQFQYDNFDLEKHRNINEFTTYVDHVISKQTNLLNSIYFKKQNDPKVSDADNKSKIQKIITYSPLPQVEYEFLLNRIRFQKYYLLTSFLSGMSAKKNSDSIQINFKDEAFRYFNKQTYKKMDNINDWHLANSLESILQIEYLKRQTKEENIKITYGNWQSFFNNSDYENWVSAYLKNNFNNDIYNKYYADISAWLMTMGMDYKKNLEKLNYDEKNNKYVKRLRNYENLLNDGLSNMDYRLKENALTLDKSKFDYLLESYKGKPLFIIFWSAQYAGASIVSQLPSIKDFEKTNKEKINIVNICIDKKEHKKLWTARIIDNSWKAKHYFLPIEGNDSILSNFSNKKISAFCDGGATYAFIGKNGVINNGIEGPFRLSKSEIEQMSK